MFVVMESHPDKNKRHEITACENSEICQYKDKNQKARLDMMTKHFDIGKSTIADIVNL